MSVTVCKLGDALGAEIVGIDVNRPIDAETFSVVNRAFLDHSVLVFRGQPMTPQQMVGFSRHFGELQPHIAKRYRLPEAPELVLMTNVDKDGNFDPVGASRGVGWHSDLCYETVPAKATLLHSIEVPDRGGDTLFANMHMAWETMSAALRRRIDGHNAYFRYGGRTALSVGALDERDKEAANVVHPAVRAHPETGRKSVYLNPYHALQMIDMAREESDALFEEVFDWCSRPEFQWRYSWGVGDTIIWDNRNAWHSGAGDAPRDQRRIFYRATVRGTPTL